MSTKNKNIKTYDLESVFDEYMKNLSQSNEEKHANLQIEIEILKADIEADMGKVDDIKTAIKAIETKEQEIKKIKVLTKEQREKLEDDITKANEACDAKILNYENLIHEDSSLFTEEQTKKWKEKIAKAEEAKNKAFARLETLGKKLEADEAKHETLNTKQEELKSLSPVKSQENENSNISFKDELNEELIVLTQSIKEKEASLKEMKVELKKTAEGPQADLESFTTFLKDNKLSTAHAEELFKYHSNPENFEQIAYDDLRMRKMHPKRDFIIKKVVIPTAITSTAIGATIGAIAGSGLVGGATVLGFIPVSGTPGLTGMATTMTGAAIGLASTPLVIKGKNLITRTYYRLKSRSADKNLEDYTSGTSIDNIKLSKFLAQIQKTQHKILETSGPRKVALNTINRNRIHQVEAVTKKLLTKYYEIDQNKSIDAELKAKQLKPIYEMLSTIQDFISDDIADAKAHAMLTCKEKKDHSHTYMIENVDIYANLKIYLDRIAQIDFENNNKKQQLKQAKKTTKNLAQKKEEAYSIINGERLVTKMLNFEDKYGQYFEGESEEPEVKPSKKQPKKETQKVEEPKPEETKPVDRFAPTPEVKVTGIALNEETGTIGLTLENGKEIKIPANSGVDLTKDIATAKESKNKYSITYADGTKQEIMKKVKVSAEVSAARHALASSLQNEGTIKYFKDKGFQTTTINTLRDKLKVWCEMENASKHESQKLVLSGKVKELYITAMDEIIKNSQEKLDIM